MYKKNVKGSMKKIVMPILVFICGLVIWEVLVLIFNIPEYILPKPTRIILEIIINLNFFLWHLRTNL